MRYSKKCAKSKCICFNQVGYMINYNENEAENENGSHRYDINRTKPRHGHKYNKFKMCLSMMMVICKKQHLNNI